MTLKLGVHYFRARPFPVRDQQGCVSSHTSDKDQGMSNNILLEDGATCVTCIHAFTEICAICVRNVQGLLLRDT